MKYIEFLTTKKYEKEFRERFGGEKCAVMVMSDMKKAIYKIESNNDFKKRSLIIYTPGASHLKGEEKIRPWNEKDNVLLPMQFLISNN